MRQRPAATSRPRPLRLSALVTAGVLLLTLGAACSPGRAGTALPDGDQAAEYVSAKFTRTLERLADDFGGNEPRRSTHRSFTRIDDKKADNTITAIQVGSPPSRLYKNHSNRDSSDYRDYFHPAGSDVEYMRLGPVYKDLAPTEWVSKPYTAGSLNVCYWGGYTAVCRMLDTVSQSMQNGSAAKQAKSLEDGSVELTAEVTLREFLDQRVVILPDWVLERISEKMRDGVLNTRIALDPEGKLMEIEMKGLISADGHEIEINEHYQVLDPPTENDLPKVPSPDEVTALTTEAQVDDFYRRMAEITSSEG
ncbi:hypothetical protein [Prauserella muralis]|uniref:Uncharacterized protein n=1 Tax=Prauserella muralis TaxID=588067 RepID=A0A2V4BAA9_9PSEU|nr:hypothetical protein [Prauserella muralis]PXY32218.1 hypothetical protein BAY60_07990 [Prauserella muralis]TWE24120.1 hypothetical protein FHX69_5427 [Prauserella muralis]